MWATGGRALCSRTLQGAQVPAPGAADKTQIQSAYDTPACVYNAHEQKGPLVCGNGGHRHAPVTTSGLHDLSAVSMLPVKPGCEAQALRPAGILSKRCPMHGACEELSTEGLG